MTTLDDVDNEHIPEIIGYAEPWIVAPGDQVAIKVSCSESEYKYRTVRLVQGIELPHSPKKIAEEITEIPRGQCPGRVQTAKPGSYGYVPSLGSVNHEDGLEVSFYVQAWLLDCPHAQTLVSTLNLSQRTGFSVVINQKGCLEVKVGLGSSVQTVCTDLHVRHMTWAKVKLVLVGTSFQLTVKHIPTTAEAVPQTEAFQGQLTGKTLGLTAGPLFIAAGAAGHDDSDLSPSPMRRVTDFFNGRLDGLTLKTLGSTPILLAKYDFSLDMSSDRIVDTSGRSNNGVLVNAPTRAVRGHDWSGLDTDWTRAKSGYGAIHFHEDDLDDAEFSTDFVITIPDTARSGAYAVEVEAMNGLDSDSVTFFVRPNTSMPESNLGKVCLVFSTFTYLAYANERLYDQTRPNTADLGPGFDIDKALKSAEFYKMRRRLDLGLSCYDRHADGSGVCYSASKRPILNVRPGYVMWGFSRPREFSADLMMLGYLEQENIPYEILTDHDLHHRGAGALQGFNTVITGCHPEYPTYESYTAYRAFSRSGGNLMYLGGNGFYWVSALDKATGTRLEVRRGDVGVRPFQLLGGEHYTSQSGQLGGLWRSRGMSCNTLFGVGFCAQGTSAGVPYKRTAASKSPKVSWMFEGIEDDVFGRFGFGGGAAGDEMDRFDLDNGSPASTIILASSTGHNDDFGIAVEDLTFPAVNTLGTQTDRIRSDVVYYVGAGGGGVFSVGSINWYCSLAWDAYENDVARLTGNVIRGFLGGKR